MSEEKEKNGEKQESLREKYGISDSLRRLMYDTNSHIEKEEKKNEEYNIDKSIENITNIGDRIVPVDSEDEKVKKYVWDNNLEDREKAKEETKNFFENKNVSRGKDIYTRNLKISEDQKAALDAFFSNNDEIEYDNKKKSKKNIKEKVSQNSIPYTPKEYGREINDDKIKNKNIEKEEKNIEVGNELKQKFIIDKK